MQRDRASKRLTISCEERAEEELVVDEILMSVGRGPSFESLHLAAAGVQTNEKGIVVDATLRTTVPHIWAAGDVSSKYQFTYVASKQGELAAHNGLIGLIVPTRSNKDKLHVSNTRTDQDIHLYHVVFGARLCL